MKKLFALFILLVPLAALAWNTAIIGGSVPSDGSGSYILEEKFEGVGAPSGFTTTGPDTTPDYDDTTAPLEGSESCEYLEGSTNGCEYTLDTSLSEVYVAFRITISDLTPSNGTWLAVRDSGDATLSYWQLRTDAGSRLYNTGGTTDITAGTFSTSVRYIKLRAIAGSGANATVQTWLSDNTTSWGAMVGESTDGTWTNNIENFRITSNVLCEIVIDHMVVDESDIPISVYQ